MATTKITSNVLALSAAQTNINNDGSFTLSVPTQINNTLSLSGNLTVDTNTLFVDSVNNRVGIGTALPTANLSIIGTGGQPYLHIKSNGLQPPGATNPFIKWDTEWGPVNGYIGGKDVSGAWASVIGSTQQLRLNVNGNDALTILTNGNVGIGTTTPAVPLQISTIVNGASLRLGQDGTVGRLEFGNINVAINRISNQLALQGFDGFTFGTQNGEKMRLTSSGNLGIGTSTPNEKLTVSGNLSASGDAFSNGAKLAAETFAIAMAIAVG